MVLDLKINNKEQINGNLGIFKPGPHVYVMSYTVFTFGFGPVSSFSHETPAMATEVANLQ